MSKKIGHRQYGRKIVVLTGTPGTGKDTIAKILETEGFEWIPINKLVEQKHLWKRKEKGAKVVDLKRLKKAIERAIEKAVRDAVRGSKEILVEGHLACEIAMKADLCIVLRTNPRILKKRLEARRYPKSKTAENIECELLDYCTQRAEKNLSCPVYEVDTSGSIRRTIGAVKAILKGKGKKYTAGSIDWSRYI
jgi:adenylate kinase